jgi:predicted RNA methylase
MFNDNKNFYPTPNDLIVKMIGKINQKRTIKNILEPSAGAGHITKMLTHREYKIDVIEIDSNLQKILIQDKYNLVGSDFLQFNDSKFYDLIIMNPPFDNGDKHLLKAIDLMYNGQIICILNAETLKNNYSVTRKELAKRLHDLGADIEYIQNAFLDSERKTSVEIALIYINIENELSKDLNLDLEVDKDTIQDIKDKTDIEINTDKMYNLVNPLRIYESKGKVF